MSGAAPDDLEARRAQRRRREKQQISCNPCRQRKVKCDRCNPCGKCVHRNDVANCSFPLLTRQRRQQPGNIQDRVARLESLVPSLVESSHLDVNHGLVESPVSDSQHSAEGFFGSIQVKQNETNYVGGEHWSVIADNLADDQESNSIQQNFSHQDTSSPELLLGIRRDVNLQSLLASIPSKAEVDHLISTFFNSMDLVVLVTHAPKFQDQYDRFWLDTASVPIKWLSMLFSMMCLATNFLPSSSKQSTPATVFCQQSARCLILADYTKPTAYNLEALLLYFHCELSRPQNTHFALHLLFTTVVRIAMKMGYHRDASHYPNISIFDGELRRRVWAHLVQLDVLTSFQVGLPRMINEAESDTTGPRNLCDEDLYEKMTSLPPSRSEDDSTKLAYIITRVKLLSVVGKIQNHVTSIHPLAYDKVIRLHELLDAQYNAVPPSLKVQRRSLVADSQNMVLRRVSLDLLYQKTRCVLHRRFLKPQHQLSWETCTDAALKIIRHQSFLYHESQPGRIECGQTWKVTCLSTYDFLLAAMIICLVLNSQIEVEKYSPSSVDKNMMTNQWEPGVLLSALEKADMIWTEWSTEIKEAIPVVDIVKNMLSRVKKEPNNNPQDSSTEPNPFSPPSTSRIATTPLAPASLGTTNNSALQPTSMQTEDINSSFFGFLDPYTVSVDGIDWAMWDSQLQNNGIYYYNMPFDR